VGRTRPRRRDREERGPDSSIVAMRSPSWSWSADPASFLISSTTHGYLPAPPACNLDPMTCWTCSPVPTRNVGSQFRKTMEVRSDDQSSLPASSLQGRVCGDLILILCSIRRPASLPTLPCSQSSPTILSDRRGDRILEAGAVCITIRPVPTFISCMCQQSHPSIPAATSTPHRSLGTVISARPLSGCKYVTCPEV